jgi:hypothetical protein
MIMPDGRQIGALSCVVPVQGAADRPPQPEATDHRRRREAQVPPDRDRVVGVLAQPADGDPAALPDLGQHERQVEEAVDGVVPGQRPGTPSSEGEE